MRSHNTGTGKAHRKIAGHRRVLPERIHLDQPWPSISVVAVFPVCEMLLPELPLSARQKATISRNAGSLNIRQSEQISQQSRWIQSTPEENDRPRRRENLKAFASAGAGGAESARRHPCSIRYRAARWNARLSYQSGRINRRVDSLLSLRQELRVKAA